MNGTSELQPRPPLQQGVSRDQETEKVLSLESPSVHVFIGFKPGTVGCVLRLPPAEGQVKFFPTWGTIYQEEFPQEVWG